MKRTIYSLKTLFFAGFATFASAQHSNEFYVDGADVVIQNGAQVHVLGDVHMQGGSLTNDGLLKVQGNMYSDNTFQQKGTGTTRMENSDVNIGERQFISGSYAVRGGTAAIGVDDGSFYNLELANDQGIVYLVGTGNIADVRNLVDYAPTGSTAPNNRIITEDVGMTGALPTTLNGADYDAVFGVMNTASAADGNSLTMLTNSISQGGNNSSIDNGYVEGKLRRAIASTGGTYGFVNGLAPGAAGQNQGVQYTHLIFANNTYDVVTGYFQRGSSNASAAAYECSGSNMNYFGGADHGEWIFEDINRVGSTGGTYSVRLWPQDDNLVTQRVWTISKDDQFVGVAQANQCLIAPHPTGIQRDGFSGFSEFAVVGAATILSNTELELSASPVNNQYIAVNWETAAEKDLDYFIIERSTDDLNFEAIATRDAQGNSSSLIVYTAEEDYNVLPGVNYYYRIKMVNLDGSHDYSYSVAAKLEGSTEGESIVLYPNPVRQANVNLEVKLQAARDVNVAVYDAIGKMIYKESRSLEAGINQFTLNTNDWPSGVYFIHLNGQNFSSVKELIKRD